MVETAVANVRPADITSVGGLLGRRFQANKEARLKDWVLSEQFIRLHEKQDHGEWFWLGEQVGKWLDASTYAGLIAQDHDLLGRVRDVIQRLARSQEADGYIGITRRRYRIPVRGMQLYEWYYVLHGLLVCVDLLADETALEIARRLGDYIIATWGPDPDQFPLAGRFPGNGHGGGEGTLILEPIVLLAGRTGDERYLDWSKRALARWDEWLAAYPESRFTCDFTAMQRFADGEKDVYELRENIHAHTFHMTLLGLAALHNVSGDERYRDIVLGAVDRLADDWIFLTGGMSSGEGYLPRRYYHPRGEIEVCPQHTWILLLDRALRWTGKPHYAAEIERDLFNHFLAAQLSDGSNWSYMTPLNGRAQEPYGPNCCNASGHRIAARMPTYLYGLRDGAPAVLQYSASAAVLHPPGLPPVALRQETDFPSSGEVIIHVEPEHPATFPLQVRIPPYVQGATARVGEGKAVPAPAGDFMRVERNWQPGDVLRLALPFSLRCQADARVTALVRGPLVYAYFQDAQDDPVVYHGRRGLYPEDVVLHVDPERAAEGVAEVPAAEDLVGPALRVPAHILARPPMFATAKANDPLAGEEAASALLLPFVNQGDVGGEFAVFLSYAPPGRG